MRVKSTRESRRLRCVQLSEYLENLKDAPAEEICRLHTTLVHFTVSPDGKTPQQALAALAKSMLAIMVNA